MNSLPNQSMNAKLLECMAKRDVASSVTDVSPRTLPHPPSITAPTIKGDNFLSNAVKIKMSPLRYSDCFCCRGLQIPRVSHSDSTQDFLSHRELDNFQCFHKSLQGWKVSACFLNTECKAAIAGEQPENLKPNIAPSFLRDQSHNTCGAGSGNLSAFFSAQLNQTTSYTHPPSEVKALLLTPFVDKTASQLCSSLPIFSPFSL